MATGEIKGLQFNLEASSNTAAKTFKELADSMKKAKSSSNNLAENLGAISKALDSFSNEQVEKLSKIADALRTIKENSKFTLKINAKDVDKLSKVKETVGDTSGGIITPTPETVTPSEQSLNPIPNSSQVNEQITKTINLTKVFKNVLNATKSTLKDIWKWGKRGGKILSSVLSAGFKHATSGMRNFINAFESIKKRIGSVLLRRVITSVLRTIWSSLNEGIEHMYQFGLSARQSFVGAMDAMATSALYLKNSLGAALAPALEALAPIIDFIVDKFVALLNIINQVISFITGKSFWTKAIKQAATFGEAAGGASGGLDKVADSAKEAKKEVDLFLASFDELHLTPKPEEDAINGKTPSGGSGGGGGAGADYTSMFENVDFDSDLKTLLEKGDWYGIGKLFADKLNVLTESADTWILNTFEPWAQTFGTNLGNTINGFVDEYNWELLGQTIADGMNALVRGANNFLTTTNWTNVGKAIGTAIKKWFDTISWTEIGQYFGNKFNVVIDTFSGLVSTIFGGNNATKMGKKILEGINAWIDTVHWDDLAESLKTGFNGAVTTFATIVNDKKTWEKLKTAVGKLFDALKEIDVTTLAQSLSTAFVEAMKIVKWETIGQKIGEFLGGIKWGEVTTTILNAGWELIKGAFKGFFEGDNAGELVGILVGLIGAKLALATISTSLKLNITSLAISKGVSSALGGAVAGSTGLSMIKSALGITSGIAITGGAIVLTIYTVMNALKGNNTMTENGKFSNPNERYESEAKGWKETIEKFFKKNPVEAVLGLKEPTKKNLQNVMGGVSNSVNSKSYKVERVLALGRPTGSNISDVLNATNKDVTNNRTKLEKVITPLKAVSTAITNALKGTATDVKNSTTTLDKNINPIKAIATVITNALKGTAKDVKSDTTNLDKNINPIKAIETTITSALSGTASDVTSNKTYLNKNINPVKATGTTIGDALKATAEAITNGRKLYKDILLTNPSGEYIREKLSGIKGVINGYDLSRLVEILFNYPAQWETKQAIDNAINGYMPVVRAKIEADVYAYYNPMGTHTKDDVLNADGGFPPEGQMFIAREAGPELVGTIGNRNAVVNNQQIVSAVAQGVASAVSGVLGSGGNQAVTVYLDGEVVYNNVVQRNNNHVARTGNSELLV